MSSTPCIRCGKDRVLAKTWKEKANDRGNVITYETYVCPDSECQKVVDQKFEDMRQKKIAHEAKKQVAAAAKAA
ncbi:MAG: hypothetical protein AAB512_00595 [Patescibacteria group bacterium]